ncbi:MAG TPA: UvrD-helicase domain-containing protein [Mycobacteriales bacterium]
MSSLGIHKDFLLEFARLEGPVQDRVHAVFTKFENATHTGLHLEKVHNGRDDRLRTIRIDGFWRGVVLAPDTGDQYTLLTVLPHDDAYAWAQRRRVSVNSATGRIEIRDIAAIDATLPELSRMAERVPERLFAGTNDADLRRLGVDEQTLTFARALTDIVQLEAARAFLPQNQWDALFGLAAGLTTEQVWAELGATVPAAPFDADDVVAAVERSPERVVLVNGPEELLAVLRHPFALWRVYLHPTQYQVANAPYRGPARVTGGPGTGKTVVALHRARYLARSRVTGAVRGPARTDGGGGVLLTTFTSTLAASLMDGLDLLVDEAAVRDQITVRHVDQLANQIFFEQHDHRPAILASTEEKALWAAMIGRLELPFTESFLAEEWRQVVLAQRITNADGYRKADRTGRGRRLGTRQKAQVWQAVWEFERELRDRQVWTYETVCVEATRLLDGLSDRPYRHVVVDEAQDLSPMQWRLLRAAVAPGPDDLFVAGDTHQRIYAHRVSLRGLGVNVVGRSARLTVNYRTTAEILCWSLGMLRGEPVDDMDGGLDSVAGYRSQLHGQPPTLRGFATRNDELAGITEQVRAWLGAGVSPAEISVAARTNALADSVLTVLGQAGIAARSLARPAPKPDPKGADGAVAVGTMHRMKGLEFRCMAVVGVNEHLVPFPKAVTPADEDELAHAHDLQRERCLLFVACTRAREQLHLSWYGNPSPFLNPVR